MKPIIAIAKPFEGAPKINLPLIFGASPKKPIILRIPVTGKRPITYGAEALPEGLAIENGIIVGTVPEEGDYKVTITASNELGSTSKEITFEIHRDKVLLTPLLGFTSWNAFGSEVSQEKLLGIADKIVSSGISEYGYSYVNLDSGWQHEYGGKFDAIMPNPKFPDMKGMCDKIHSYGLKCGIYSTPMLAAWGCPKEYSWIPGCTCGSPNELFSDMNGGIGTIRKEKNNALQWADWGFDYLKYDWRPCDPYNAELMRKELMATDRDFGFCVTVAALEDYHNYWQSHCNSYRCNCDTCPNWATAMEVYKTYRPFMNYINKGHFFDLDMLDVGTPTLFGEDSCQLNEEEQLVQFSMRALFSSPIQISSTLENLNDFELSMYCNEEVLAIHQDIGFSPARPCIEIEDSKRKIHIYKKKLHDGSYAYGIFNLGENAEWISCALDDKCRVRDLWAKEYIETGYEISAYLVAHSARLYRVEKV